MNNDLLWELIQNNANHIVVINGEMGVIAQRMAVVETKVNLIFYLVTGLGLKAVWEVVRFAKNHYNNHKK